MRVAAHPNAIAALDGDLSLTYAALGAEVDTIWHGLNRVGGLNNLCMNVFAGGGRGRRDHRQTAAAVCVP